MSYAGMIPFLNPNSLTCAVWQIIHHCGHYPFYPDERSSFCDKICFFLYGPTIRYVELTPVPGRPQWM